MTCGHSVMPPWHMPTLRRVDSRSGAPPHPTAPAAPGVPGTWRLTAAPVDASVPLVRHAVRDLLHRRQAPVSPDRLGSLLLIVSELVTNAVRHAVLLTPQIGVEVTLTPGRVRVAVEDGHPYRPKALETGTEHTSGRGLLLVKIVTREAGGRCGVDSTAAGGKIVWAELPCDRH